MEKNNTTNLQQTVTNNVQQLADMSLSFAKPVIENMLSNFSTISKSLFANDGTLKIPEFKLQGNSCTPKNECPPHCIATISRTAMPDERIIVPFTIKNTTGTEKTYMVGVRELKDIDGNMAPSQPQLNKSSVTLSSGASVRVLMGIDLGKFDNGKTYNAEIVVREKEYNQNICFTLMVSDDAGITVTPYEESKYKVKWHSWESHYYCEPKKNNNNNITGG